MTVERTRVAEVLALQRRKVVVEPGTRYEEIGVRSFGRGIFHKEPVSGIELGNKKVFRIEPGDLVLSNVFAWEGAIAVASGAEGGKIGSHRFMTFTPRDARIDSSWARWWFLSEPGLELIRKASPGSAGRNRTLAIDRFESLEIPLPPIEVQRRAAARIDQLRLVANTIEDETTRIVERLNALRTSLARHDGERLALDQLVEPVSRPLAIEPDVEYRLVGCRWYSEGLFERERKTGRDVAATRLYSIQTGDLVYNRLFAWKGSFGIVPAELHGATVSGEFPTFLVDSSRILPDYLLAATTSQEFLDQVDLRSSGSTPTSRNRLKERDFLQIEITVPPLEAQRTAVASIERLTRVREARSRQDAITKALVPAALNEAFTGLS